MVLLTHIMSYGVCNCPISVIYAISVIYVIYVIYDRNGTMTYNIWHYVNMALWVSKEPLGPQECSQNLFPFKFWLRVIYTVDFVSFVSNLFQFIGSFNLFEGDSELFFFYWFKNHYVVFSKFSFFKRVSFIHSFLD